METNDNLKNFFTFVESKYNLLRVILFDLINYYTSIHNYYIQYIKFLSHIRNKYPLLAFIHDNKSPIKVVKSKTYKSSKNTTIILGIRNYYKYKSIKYILNKIMTYNKEIYKYLVYLESCIVRLVNGMNKFNRFYSYCLHIYFQYDIYNDESNTYNINQLLNSFNTVKHNYLYNSTVYLNNS